MAEKQKEKKIRSDIVRDSLYTFGTNIIGTILGLVSSIFVLHRINPKIRGYYSELQTWGGGFNTILGLSIASAAIYFVAHYRTENSKGALKRFTIITFAIIAVGSTAVLVSLRDSRLFNTTPASYLVAILVYALLSLLQNVVIGALRGQNKFKMFNIITLTQRILATMLDCISSGGGCLDLVHKRDFLCGNHYGHLWCPPLEWAGTCPCPGE